MNTVLEISKLEKWFGKFQALRGLDMAVKEGDMYGLLGVNGAGKTTTMRSALGLIKYEAGRVAFFGESNFSFEKTFSRVGALVEIPVFYPHLTGYENLRAFGFMRKVKPDEITEALRAVGLEFRAHNAVRQYSQGMAQRLGIALALLGKPRLVILDEPTNGLDPRAIINFREMVKGLNQNGTTFVISSHNIHEVEVTCNRVGIVKEGAMVYEGNIADVIASTTSRLRLEVGDVLKADEVVRTKFPEASIIEKGNGFVIVDLTREKHAQLNAALVEAGVQVSAFAPIKLSLEEYFMKKGL